MSSILGSERKPNATARCEQLIVDGSLQVAGLYIDGTAAGGGAELAAIINTGDSGVVVFDNNTDAFTADTTLNNRVEANTVGRTADRQLIDANVADIALNTPAIQLNTTFRETALNESFYKAQDAIPANIIQWVAPPNEREYEVGTTLTIKDQVPTRLVVQGAVDEKYLIEIQAAVKIPDTITANELQLLIREHIGQVAVNVMIGRFIGVAESTQNVVVRGIVAHNAEVEFVFNQAIVAIDGASTSVTCRRFR